MPRDYAKRPSRSGASNRSSSKLWLVTLVLIGLFAAGIFYLKQQSSRLVQQEALKEKMTKNHTTEHASITAKEQTPPAQAQQKFDFYTMLPKVQVPAPKEDEKQTSTANQTNPAKAPTSGQASQQPVTPAGFMLQLGVFKNFASADELKAQIVLQGFEANTAQIKRGNVMLYRVWIGPYKTRADAQKQQKNLEANQIKSTLVKTQP